MIYIIHFREKLAHAAHYIGFVDGDEADVQERLKQHKSGAGAKILAECNRRGIEYDVVRILPGSRNDERALKNRKKGSSICPICSPKKFQPC